ncbi:hypothetical protein [uncultured Lutibacter sp.]|uniref:hypothetical protein n=1 Tax=uncultured Lutibacter sp. TaxID=437739 RepID=UPI0026074BA9|nr:hypothetical protein [uncultured Lutibacter sp.]
MKKTTPFKNFHLSILLFILMVFISENILGQLDPYKWSRLPSNLEINEAVKDLTNQLNKTISVNGKVVDNQTPRMSQPIKFHNKRQAGILPPQDISRTIIYVEVTGIMGSFINEYNLFQNKQTGKFGFAKHASVEPGKSLNEKYNQFIAYLKSYPNNDSGLALGFAPSLKSNKSSVNKDAKTNEGSSNNNDDIPWEVIIAGAALGAAIVAIRKRLKKSKQSKNKKENKKENEEKAGYILQLSTEKFDFSEEKQGNLEVRVVKVTETSQKSINAAIQIVNSELALLIQPTSGTTPFNCQLSLKEQPTESQFKITIVANAEGHQYQKDVTINAGGEPKIVFETAPNNKRSLRPDINRLITLYAQVVDVANKPIDNLTKSIDFTPLGDWAEISEPVWDDGWAGINVGASNPNPVAASSHPPATMEVLMSVELEDEEEPLQEKLLIHLLDCYLESEIYHCTFPVTDEKTQIRFKVWIENAGEEEKWKFTGMYRIGVDIEDDPLTEINFEKESETEMWVILTGPIMELPKGNRSITKTLVIGASQEEEEPIESHISVTISKEGLYLERGFDKKKSIQIYADKPVEKPIELSLFRYDEKSNTILPDKIGLSNLKFELLNNEKAIKNLVSILQPEITFDQLVSTVPYARYTLKTAEEIPGAGETYELNYSISAETSGDENPEDFYHEITVKVKTKDVGKKIKTWEEAYRECKYMIDNYVPHSNAREKLTQILEIQKHFLDTEGLVELRNRIGHIAAQLVLAEGAEGYKEVDKWANRIVTTLEWTQWAGDLCFAALASYYLKGLGATAAGMIKAEMIDAINFFIYEKDTGWEAFKNRQIDKLMPYLMSTTKGRLLNIENIEKLVGKNKALCWAVYVSTQFLFHLYQTKSMIQAAKNTGREVRDELLVQFLGKQLKSRHGANDQKPQKENSQKENPQKDKVQNEKNKQQKLPNSTESAAVKKKLAELESEIRTNRIGGKFMDKQKVLEIMEDPAVVRTIKNHGSPELKKAFDGPRKKIYQEHDRILINDLARELKMNPKDLEVDDFRTPGDTSDNLNTDRDYRVVRKVKLKNGKIAKVEVSRKVFEAKSNRIFGELTNKPPHISDADWAARKQQLATDFTCEEANIDYSDQKIDPNTGKRTQGKANIINVKDGKSVLKNPESMGDMYKNKVKNAGERPEKYAQAQKATKTIKKVKQGYEKQNYKTKPTSDKLEKAMKVIDEQPTDVDMTSEKMAETHKKLQDLGYDKGLEDVMKDIDGEFKSLKNVTKKGMFERLFG